MHNDFPHMPFFVKFVFSIESSDLKISIDMVDYVSGQDVTIDGGNHLLQCIASNVHPDTTVTWKFGDNIYANRWTLSSEYQGNGLVDITNTINVLDIAAGSSNAISCFMRDTDNRQRRQIAPDVLVSIIVAVQGITIINI